jgi:hypothetical protein
MHVGPRLTKTLTHSSIGALMSIHLGAAKPSTDTPLVSERRSKIAGHPSRSTLGSRGRSVPWSDELSKRADSIRNAVLNRGRERSSFKVNESNTGDVVLSLRGDLSAGSVPQLEAVLHAVVLLQPIHLVVDLLEVSRVSAEALNTLLWCAISNDNVLLKSPDPQTHAEVTKRGHGRWIVTDPFART